MHSADQLPNLKKPSNLDEGLVIKNFAGFYYVQDQRDQIFECKVRGKVKERILSGDKVLFYKTEDKRGIIEKVLPRKNQLYRPRVANVSLVLIILACNNPKPDLNLLDRLLFLAAFNNINPCIVLNKSDLDRDINALNIMQYYPRAGFKLITTSVRNQTGIEEIKLVIKNKIAVLAGPSGSGKTSLLNSVRPESRLNTQEVSRKIGRGRHTTRHVELYPLDSGGWIVDTPGFSVLDMPDIKREELKEFFPDFQVYADQCRFGDCLHFKESECQVVKAVAEGKILASRYKNYVNMLKEIMERERCY